MVNRRSFVSALAASSAPLRLRPLSHIRRWFSQIEHTSAGERSAPNRYSRYRYSPTPLPAVYTEPKLEEQLANVARGIPWPAYSVDVRDFGATGSGSGDDTAAFQNAILAAQTAYNAAVLVPNGVFNISAEIAISQGIMLVAPGSQGSTEEYGCVVIHHSDQNLFRWDGANGFAAGTGGGLKNMLLLKARGHYGGDAVYLHAVDDNHRPGEMMFENVLISAQSGGSGAAWDRGMHIDGTRCTTPGSKGVRSVVLHKFRVASCKLDHEYLRLTQAVHFSATHIQIDQGGGKGLPGLLIDGDSDNIMLANAIIDGTLVLRGSSAMNVCLHGRISELDIVNDRVRGAATIQSERISCAATEMRLCSNSTDAFAMALTSDADAVTGDGTPWMLAGGRKQYDKNQSFDDKHGVFTARCAGIYVFEASVLLSRVGAKHTQCEVSILHSASATQERTITPLVVHQNPLRVGDGTLMLSGTTQLQLARGDTVRVFVQVTGGERIVGVRGSELRRDSRLSGHFVS